MTKQDRIKRVVDREVWGSVTQAPGRPVPRKTVMARWSGRWPRIGDYLRCDSPRARKAYRIVEILRGLSATEYRPISVEAWPLQAVPEDATVHLFQRHRRRRRD